MDDEKQMLKIATELAMETAFKTLDDLAKKEGLDLSLLPDDIVSSMKALYAGGLISGIEVGIQLAKSMLEMRNEESD
jgi:hypothetical protein